MAQQQSHVPKFGNWDNDNTPYTVYFENARKEKIGGSGVRMNPNDPEENPEAFSIGRGRMMNPNDPEDNPDAFMAVPPSPLHINSRLPPLHHDTAWDDNYDEPQSGGLRSSTSALNSSHATNRGGLYGNYTPRAASVPKFGVWEEKDPRAGDGFTVIFNKAKEEKHMPSVNFPVPPQQTTYSHIQQQKQFEAPSPRSKVCCCFFWS